MSGVPNGKHVEQPSGGLATKMLGWVNDLAHKPVLEYVFNWTYWAFHLLVTTPLYLPAYLMLTAHDLVTGYPFVWVKEDPQGKAVVITGCDTGFGLELALALSKKGWKVYAGCLSEAGVAVLQKKGEPNLIAVKLDVTKAEDIEAVVAKVDAENPQGLYAVVNNAGRPIDPFVWHLTASSYHEVHSYCIPF
jgi:3-hydroxybutyrate dehydrogenase